MALQELKRWSGTISSAIFLSVSLLIVVVGLLSCGVNATNAVEDSMLNFDILPGQFVNYNTSFPFGYFHLEYVSGGKLVMGSIPTTLYNQLKIDGHHSSFKVIANMTMGYSILQFRLYTGLESYFILYNPSYSETVRVQYFVVEKVWREVKLSSQSTTMVISKNDAEEFTCKTCLKTGKSNVRLKISTVGSYGTPVTVALSFDGSSFVGNELTLHNQPVTYSRIYVPETLLQVTTYVPFYMRIFCNTEICPLVFNIEEYTPSDSSIVEIVIIVAVIGAAALCGITIIVVVILVCVVTIRKCTRKEKEPSHLEEHHHELLTLNPNQTNTTNSLQHDRAISHNPVIYSDHHETDLPHSTIDTFHTLRTNTSSMTYSTNNQQSVSSTTSNADDVNSNLLKNRYEVMEKIGSGSFGDCFLCKDTKNSNRLVAIKCIRVSDNELEKAIDECSKTLTFKHVRLVEVYELFVSKRLNNALCLVMKYYKGDLDKCLKINGIFSENLMLGIINQIGDGLCYLHTTRNVLHRDLKPKNIFVDTFDPFIDKIEVVIGDYGEAKELGNENNSVKGTIAFMSPECLSNENYGMPSDIFSLGVSFYQLMTNDPLQSIVATHLLSENEEQVLSKLYKQIKQQTIPYSEQLIQFILSMMKKNPSTRPTCTDLRDFQLTFSQ